ncbi:MAG: phosphoribosylglycinamide formyltransferase [Prevotella sp.]|jgi:phosphoribosylglycinamide formyltransferase-1|nr:phosphoribosylglycinamide formyltransferase [Prevotella sp.]
MSKIAIFASGSGTNAENIAKYFKNSKTVEISLIVSNKKDAFVLERAKKLEIEAVAFSKNDFDMTGNVVNFLQSKNIDFIVLAGFLLKIPGSLLKAFPHKIVNIHPALLPKFGGKGMYGDNVHKAVVESKESESGITIHYINENYDEGDIIFQAKCPVLPNDTFEDVAKKVHALEYTHFPVIIKDILSKQD